MNYTNKYKIPEPIAKQLQIQPDATRDYFRVTELIKSPRQVQLLKRHNDNISSDVSDLIWAWDGTVNHLVLQNMASEFGAIAEKTLSIKVLKKEVRGTPDFYYQRDGKNGLSDLKTTSVYSFLLEKNGVKPDWEKQLNIYSYMLKKHQMPVDRIEIWAKLRDWNKQKTKTKDYPKSPILVRPVKQWSSKQVKKYLDKRVRLHTKCQKIKDDKLPFCSPEERWAMPDTYAVKKKGRKSAVRVFYDKDEAKLFTKGTKLTIEKRPGLNNRCERFCLAAPFCNQFKELKNK